MAKKQQSKLRRVISKLNPTTPKGMALLFVLIFALVGGGVLLYQSFAAANIYTLVFTGKPSGSYGLYTIRSDGANLRKLNNNGYNPKWSPDRNYILYQQAHNNLYYMSNDGSSPRPIIEVKSDSSYAYHIEDANWGPDNKSVVYTQMKYPVGGGQYLGSTIWRINIDGSNKVKLSVEGGFNNKPHWSKTGAVAYIHKDTESSKPSIVRRKGVDGSNKKVLINSNPTVLPDSLFWSPNGEKLAFSTYGSISIFIMNADGTSLRRLMNHPGTFINAEYPWSPDGNHIAFRYNAVNDPADIYVADVGNGSFRRITSNDMKGVFFNTFGWNPRGNKIVYALERNLDDNYGYIYMKNADGSGTRNLIVNTKSSFTLFDW